MIAYHGTDKEFEKFDNKFMAAEESYEQLGSGFYFCDYIERCQQHGNIILTCEIPDEGYVHQFDDTVMPTRDQIRRLISLSSDYDALTNFGDVAYYGRKAIIEQAVDQFEGNTYFQLCLVLARDLYKYDSYGFNQAFHEVTGYVGTQDCHVYCVFSASNIKIINHNT